MKLKLTPNEVQFIQDNFDSNGRCFNPNINQKEEITRLQNKCCIRHKYCPWLGSHYYLIGNAATIKIQQSLSELLQTTIEVCTT